MPVHQNDYVLGKGKVFFNPLDAQGNEMGERYLGNCPAFTVSVESETLEHFSSESGISERDAEATISITRASSITCDNISMENLALFVIGDIADIVQTATPVVAEPITGANQDRYYQLGKTAANPTGVRGVTAITVNGSGGTPTYVLDTDYEEDLAHGTIYIIPGGGIVDGTDLEVDYTPDANQRQQVASSSLTATTGELVFRADNPKGTNKDVRGPLVELRPSGENGFISEEWAEMAFEVAYESKDANTAQVYIDGRPV